MAGYTTENPMDDGVQHADGTTVHQMTALPEGTQYMPDNGRFPAFIGLARQTGGAYAENLAGMPTVRMLEAAKLDFSVAFRPNPSVTVIDQVTEDVTTEVDGELISSPITRDVPEIVAAKHLRATVATWPKGPDGVRPPRVLMGTVKRRYQLVQPTELADFGQVILDESGSTGVAAAGYGEPFASRIFFAFKLPDELLIGGVDKHDVYLYVGTSYDGSTSTWGCVAPLRIACTNQVPGLFGGHSNRFQFTHSGNIAQKFEDARRVLKITNTFTERYAAWAERALATPMSPTDVTAFLEKVLPTPTDLKTAAGAERWEDRRRQAAHVILRGEHNEFGRGTAYGTFHGLVEHTQHFRPVRGGDALRRYVRIVDGDDGERMLVRAQSLLV